MKFTALWENLERKQKVATAMLVVYAILFSLAQLGRQQWGEVVFYPSDLLVGGFIALHILELSQFWQKTTAWLKRHPLSWFVLLWIVGTLLLGSVLSQQIRPFLVIIRLIIYFGFAGCVGIVFAEKPHYVRWLLAATGGLMALFGLFQYIVLPDTRFLMNLGWDDHYYRLLGTFFDPNFAGMGLILTALAILSLHQRFSKSLLIGLLMILVAGITLTYSRSSYLALMAASLGVIFLPKAVSSWELREKIVLGATMLVTAATILLIAPKPGGEGVKLLRTASISARVNDTQNYVSDLRPWTMLFGSGLFVEPAAVKEAQFSTATTPTTAPLQSVFFTANPDQPAPNHSRAADNIFITLVSGLGVVGTIGAVALALIFLHDLSKHELLSAIALGSVLVHAQFNNTLFEPFIFQFLMLFILVPLPIAGKLEKRFRSKKRNSRSAH